MFSIPRMTLRPIGPCNKLQKQTRPKKPFVHAYFKTVDEYVNNVDQLGIVVQTYRVDHVC